MIDALAAEWIKIRSVRSTYIILGVALSVVGLCALLAWYFAYAWDALPAERRAQSALSPLSDLAAWCASLCLAVLGVLTITTEYRTGAIRTTLAAVPARRTLLAAKAVVVAGVSLAAGLAVTFGAFAASRLMIGDRPVENYTSPVSAELGLLFAASLSVVMFALLGLGLGALMRSATAAIATLSALWYVVPIVAANLPSPWADRLTSVMLTDLPRQLAGASHRGLGPAGLLSPPGAAAVMIAYAVVPLAAAAVLINRRDA